MKADVWRRGGVGFVGAKVEEKGGRPKSFDPVGNGHGCLNEQGAEYIIRGAKGALSLAILRRGVWAGKSKDNAMLEKQVAIASVVKFSAIVTLKKSNGCGEMGRDKLLKLHKNAMNIRFGLKRKRPHVVSEIINHNQIIFVSRHTENRGRPNITM